MNSIEMHKEMRRFLLRINFTLFVSLTFNREMKPQLAASCLGRFHKWCDRRLLGPNYFKKPEETRTLFVAIPEKMDCYLHYHLLLRPALQRNDYFRHHAPIVWSKICPGGEIDIKDINTVDDRRRIVSYVLKDIWKSQNYENFVLSGQFL